MVTGATGFIGKKLLTKLSDSGYKVKAMSRSKYPDTENIQYVKADALDAESLSNATNGIETAFYLLHSMEGSKKEWGKFASREKQQAENFLKAATDAGKEVTTPDLLILTASSPSLISISQISDSSIISISFLTFLISIKRHYF